MYMSRYLGKVDIKWVPAGLHMQNLASILAATIIVNIKQKDY